MTKRTKSATRSDQQGREPVTCAAFDSPLSRGSWSQTVVAVTPTRVRRSLQLGVRSSPEFERDRQRVDADRRPP